MLIILFILGHVFSFLTHSSEGKVNLRHSQSNKHFINQLDAGSFEIVHPFQVRDKNERVGIDTHNYFLNATTHYKHVVIVIRSNTIVGIRLKLVLTLNDYLFFNETQFKKLNEDGESALDGQLENCYYQGEVNNDPSSFVAISTCNGIWGVIAFENGTTLGIRPLEGGDRGRRHPHVLYRTRWKRDAACGAVTQTLSEFLPLQAGLDAASSALMKIKRDVTRQMKYLELAVFGDYKFMRELNATDKEGMEYMLNAINIADALVSGTLRIRLSVVYAEVWLDAQRVDLHDDIQRTLSGALDYITGHIYHVEKDASIMFTDGHNFVNSEMLTAAFSSVCTARAVGIAKAVDSYFIHETAQLVSHVVGHIIGIDHDSSECVCRDNSPCVMNRQIGAMGSSFSWEYSKCSVARLHNVLQSEHFQCLLTRPFQSSRLHSCGNGVVDGDEECDCGRRDECVDPCCDPITCTLKAHARCAAHQTCCHRCELRPSGHICRESNSVCDVAEICDGLSGDCPADGHLIDGVLCGINGHCWKGNCSDSEQQCKELWGSASKLADDPCFDSNQKGVEYGNCGANRNGEFLSCSEENQKCGTLHCKDGNAMPHPSSLMSFNLQFVHNGRQVQCKAIIGTESDVALVKDGTSCAAGKICIENACVPLSQVSAPVSCPSNNVALQCSGHGDCTTTQRCVCYDGWAGTSCEIRSNTSRRIFPTVLPPNANEMFPPFKVGRALDTPTLLGILLVVGIFLLLVLICLLFCYRRRSSAELHRADEALNKVEDEMPENENRVVKFGVMPSYREEMRRQGKNKHIYGALHRITEAEERDSISVKSRESSTLASSINNLGQQSEAQIPLNGGGSMVNGSVVNQPNNYHPSSNGSHQGSNPNIHLNTESQQGFYRSNECIAPNGLLQRQNFKREDSYCSDSMQNYENHRRESSSQQNLYRNNFSSQQLSQLQNPYMDSSSRVLERNTLNNGHNFYSKYNNNNSSHNGSNTNCYSPSRSDFCADANTVTENLLRRNAAAMQQQPSRNLFADRNGYATDSEVVTSGFCSGGSGNASLRYAAAALSASGFSSPRSSPANAGSNRNSGDTTNNEIPPPMGLANGGGCSVAGILSNPDGLNPLSDTPPPPLRLQMLMKLNATTEGADDSLNHYQQHQLRIQNPRANNLNNNGSDRISSTPSEPNSFELNEMFISSREPTFEKGICGDFELTSRNVALHHNLHQHQSQQNTQMGGGASNFPEPPPASADSGHPGSNYDIQDSPSLFSDTFKLDLSN